MALIERWGKAAILVSGTLALVARCSSVVDDPTGHDNPLDKIFMAGFNAVESARSPGLVNGQSVVTKSVFQTMHAKSKGTNFVVYARNLVGNEYSFLDGNNSKPGWEQFYDIAKLLKDNPRGTRANTYTDDELKGFYLYFFKQVSGGPKYNEKRVSSFYSVDQLACLVHDAARDDYIHLMASVGLESTNISLKHEEPAEAKISASEKERIARREQFYLSYLGKKDPTWHEIMCAYVARNAQSQQDLDNHEIVGRRLSAAMFSGHSDYYSIVDKDRIVRFMLDAKVVCPRP
ncbi:hypothetical protein [Accumulibacter sp.]|uniref:hypothetical protein n=1 Tax=Accumulibacter sp. TaxID=2053492 RepID=UPI0025CDA980|nr:hypothetical protein [Accumulibacter sp.]MCM8641535.1 hypothetical protein [Accumulibacter sp.]